MQACCCIVILTHASPAWNGKKLKAGAALRDNTLVMYPLWMGRSSILLGKAVQTCLLNYNPDSVGTAGDGKKTLGRPCMSRKRPRDVSVIEVQEQASSQTGKARISTQDEDVARAIMQMAQDPEGEVDGHPASSR